LFQIWGRAVKFLPKEVAQVGRRLDLLKKPALSAAALSAFIEINGGVAIEGHG
jgi:hypothetical protein